MEHVMRAIATSLFAALALAGGVAHADPSISRNAHDVRYPGLYEPRDAASTTLPLVLPAGQVANRNATWGELRVGARGGSGIAVGDERDDATQGLFADGGDSDEANQTRLAGGSGSDDTGQTMLAEGGGSDDAGQTMLADSGGSDSTGQTLLARGGDSGATGATGLAVGPDDGSTRLA